MLLAGLQRQPHRRLPRGILRHADQPARHVALEPIAGGKEPGMRAAEAHRHAEALRRSDHHIRAHLAGWGQQRQRQRIGGDDRQRVNRVRRGDFLRQVAQGAGRARILQHQRKRLHRADRRRIAGGDIHQSDPDRPRPGRQHGACLRMQISRNRQHVGFRLAEAVRHRHRFRRGGRLVEQRCIGDLHARQVADHRLKIQQRFQPALGDLRLVGRVSGVPAGTFQHVAQDDGRRHGAVVAHADQRLLAHIPVGQTAQFGDHPGLIQGRRQIEAAVHADRFRHGHRGDVGQGRGADRMQHGSQIGFRRPDMTAHESIRRFQLRQLSQGIHAHSVSRNSS